MSRVRPRDKRNLFYHDGSWWVDIRINKVRYRQKAGATEREARIFRDKLLGWKRDTRSGVPAMKPETESISFAAHAEDFLNDYCKPEKRSWKRDEQSLTHLKRFFKDYTLSDIDPRAVDKYRASRSGISTRTVNLELACLRTALKKAVEWGRLPSYPLKDMKLMRKEKEFKPRILEPWESRALVAAADPKYARQAFTIYLSTGLRHRELLKLKREDVNFKGYYLTVVAENAKSGKTRIVPLNPEAEEALLSCTGKEYFFENAETKTHMKTLRGAFKAALETAGIKGRVRIHDLRDTFATWMLRGGIDIRTVADLIGDTPEVCLKRYCHTDEKMKRLAAAQAYRLIFGSGQKLHEPPAEAPVSTTQTVN